MYNKTLIKKEVPRRMSPLKNVTQFKGNYQNVYDRIANKQSNNKLKKYLIINVDKKYMIVFKI